VHRSIGNKRDLPRLEIAPPWKVQHRIDADENLATRISAENTMAQDAGGS
jgi:hypothetical protein